MWAFIAPLTESMDSVVYIDKQRMSRSDCTDGHADLDLCCFTEHKGLFSNWASYGPCHVKTLWAYADSEGPDEHVHRHSLTRTFSVCLQNH